MPRGPRRAAAFTRETEGELQALAFRLQEALASVDGESATVRDELLGALDEIHETQEVIADHAAAFEESVAEERALYRDLFDRAPDAYLVTDADGVMRDANGAAAAFFGRPGPFLLGKPLALFVAEESRRDFRRLLLTLSKTPIADVEVKMQTRSDVRDVEVRAASEIQPNTRPVIRWILRDITARRHAEAEARSATFELGLRIEEATRELAERNAQLEAAIRELPQGVMVVGFGGELQFANRRAHEILGQSDREIAAGLRAADWRVFDEDGAPRSADTLPLTRALARGERVVADRLVYERRDGTRLLLEATAVPVLADGAIASVVVTFVDITDRDRRERAERDFVTNAAHELQTPLAAMTSAIDVLQSGAKDDPADRERFLAHIERSTARLSRLTRALLVLARAQTREEVPRHEVVEVEPLLESLAAELHGATISLECEPDVAVVANRVLLEQALANLAQNAVKHAPGDVTLRASRENGRVAIEVRDRGPGIEGVDRALVFKRFYRGDDAASEGFGLGLAIVREAVEAIGGELELDSGPGGTRVSIVLPGATVRGR